VGAKDDPAMRYPQVFAVTVVALGLVAAGCGGGNDTDALQPQTQVTVDDQRRADRIILRLADFPSGWRAEADENQDDADCYKVDFGDLTITGRAESKSFVKGNVPFASSVAVLYKTPQQAGTVFDEVASDKLAGCFADYMKSQSADDVTIGETSFGELGFPELGDRSAAYQIAIELKTEGLTPTMFIDLVFIQRDRALAMLAFVDLLSAFDQPQKEALAKTVAERMDP
jgi:hypothetical protein